MPSRSGYLWVEFVRGDDYLICGCGIRANRASDTVTTWWWITSRRPGIDLDLVADRRPLSAEALRAVIGPEAKFRHEDRKAYREEVRRRLFGGAEIDQHIRLLHVVRSPRVGDRIDQDLPSYLRDALPQLPEPASRFSPATDPSTGATAVGGLTAEHARFWAKDLVAAPERLARRVVDLLVSVRVRLPDTGVFAAGGARRPTCPAHRRSRGPRTQARGTGGRPGPAGRVGGVGTSRLRGAGPAPGGTAAGARRPGRGAGRGGGMGGAVGGGVDRRRGAAGIFAGLGSETALGLVRATRDILARVDGECP